MDRKHIHQHYQKADAGFVDQVLEWFDRVDQQYTMMVTNFLDPHQVVIVQQLAGRTDLQVFVSSDFYPSEYARVIIAPAYYALDTEDFAISLIEIGFASKFNQLRHSQILGTLLNQLGMERWVFGDILVGPDKAQFYVDARMSDHIVASITKISRVAVKLRAVPLTERMQVEEKVVVKDILASSLRLDKIVAASFNLARAKASQLITSGKVKVNYHEVDQVASVIQVGDLISVRGFGRLTVLEEKGLSRQGKHKLSVEVLRSKKS